jgi:hypothetical protein
VFRTDHRRPTTDHPDVEHLNVEHLNTRTPEHLNA